MLQDLKVEFDTVTALDDVTHTFEPASATAVMGVNGSGKTTMLECLAGLQRPTSGTIKGMPRNLGYLCQHSPCSWMPITAGEVLAMGRYRRLGLIRRLRAADRDVMNEVAEKLDVSHLLRQSFSSLSGGQQQRVRIAQVLAAEPDVIMLDEPVTGLDIPSQERILAVIEEYSSRGAVVIITTHHIDEARHCDSVMLMANRLVASGAPDEILETETLRAAFGERLLGAHADHDHDHELIVLDDHGHHSHGHNAHGHDHGGHGDHGHAHRENAAPRRAGAHHGADCPSGSHRH